MDDIIFKSTLIRNTTMSSDEPGQFRFEGLNTGNEDIKVTKCTTSCGCTTATYPKTVHPGETFYVIVTINKTGQKGKFNQSATLTYSNEQMFKLRINGIIE